MVHGVRIVDFAQEFTYFADVPEGEVFSVRFGAFLPSAEHGVLGWGDEDVEGFFVEGTTVALLEKLATEIVEEKVLGAGQVTHTHTHTHRAGRSSAFFMGR